MVALTKAAQAADYPSDVVLVVSNIPSAAGLQKADALGVTAMAIDHTEFPSRRKFEKALHAVLQEAKIDLICCAGFMRVLTPWFCSRWENRLLNIHPSLLPKYKGLNTHQRALDAGDCEHGCSVHFVTAELDAGKTILQHSIIISPDDTNDSLAARLLPIEQALYVRALEKVSLQMQDQ